ncbi:MAG: cytochrome P450 [Chlorobi bacterium CHB2]|nr:cytochrome P450 [Chlorobi bacterium CHB2]
MLNTTQSRPLPRGPKGRPLVGVLPQMRRRPLQFMAELARTHGDAVQVKIAHLQACLLSHPDLVEEVLVTQNRKFIKPLLLKQAAQVLGNGLLTSDGEFWLRQRRLAQPAFHRDRIAGYAELMATFSDQMTDRWRSGQAMDIHEEMMGLTLKVVARALFGADVSGQTEAVGRALDLAMQRFTERLSLMRLFDQLPLPRNIRFRQRQRELDAIIYGMIEARRNSQAEADDLLSMLLHAQDTDGSQMTDQQLHDEVITLFLAGHETTAIALSWTWMLLANHPEAEARLHEELDRVLGSRPPTFADIPNLPWTEMVVKESMRLYPPAWRVGRQALEDCTIGGYHIPKGMQVVASQWVIHRDPRWYARPNDFLPERWQGDLARQLPKFAYFPFGGGPRRCIGDEFAKMEAVLILAAVARRFRITLVPNQQIDYFPSITLRPKHGIQVRVEPRVAPPTFIGVAAGL